MNETKGVKYQMNEYSMIPNECVVRCWSVRVLWMPRFVNTASLPNLVSRVALILTHGKFQCFDQGRI